MKYIDTPESLAPARRALEACPWAAVDTEADSLHHYKEKLCLVQISVPDEDFVIDPLAGLELGFLGEILSRKPLIMHGADFDVRMLSRACGVLPAEVFDTVIAAQLLGYEKQGLADLVLKHCGVSLSKSSQTADWSMRPLKPEMLEYAVKDTHYLYTIKSILEEELKTLGRLSWHEQFCGRVVKHAVAAKEGRVEEEERWRIKGSRDLNPRQQTILKFLWQWRESEAERRDRPSFKIINSETLVDIARWIFQNQGKDIGAWPEAPRNVKGEYRAVLNRMIEEAFRLPEVKPFVHKRDSKPRKRMRPDSKEKLGHLKVDREKLAKELKINPSLIVSNAVLEEILLEDPKTSEALENLGVLLPWQFELCAEGILKALETASK